MANFNDIQTEIAQDEEIVDVPIFKKDGSPYLAPDGETQCTIGVRGSDSKKVKTARDANQRKLLRDRRTKMTPEELRANRTTVAAAAIARWQGWTSGDDGAFDCSPENVRAMLSVDHILEQVEEGITGHADFFAKSSTR